MQWQRKPRETAVKYYSYSIQYVYYFRAYLFAAFKESMTLNLTHRSFKVINFGTSRKRWYIFVLVVNSNLDPMLHHFRDMAA